MTIPMGAMGSDGVFDFSSKGTEVPVFESRPVHMPGPSEQAGHPVFVDVEFVHIYFPGNQKKVIFEKVNDTHRQKYAKEYEAFKRQGSGTITVDGIPLSEWAILTKAQVKTFESFNIYTIEQLASVPATNFHQMPPGIDKWVMRAQAHIDALKDDGSVDRIAAELANLKEQAAIRDGQMEELKSLLANATAQLEGLKAAGMQGIGPAHMVNLAGAQHAPAPIPSALDAPPPVRRGRPTNAERAARAAAPAA